MVLLVFFVTQFAPEIPLSQKSLECIIYPFPVTCNEYFAFTLVYIVLQAYLANLL